MHRMPAHRDATSGSEEAAVAHTAAWPGNRSPSPGFGSHPFREAAGTEDGVEHRKLRSIDAETVADALAVLMVDLASALPGVDRREALERLANRLDDRGRVANGTPAAALLGQVSVSLMRMGL